MTGISRKLPDTERARLKKILRGDRPRERRRHRAHRGRGRQRGGAARATSPGSPPQWEDIKAKAASSQTKAPTLLHGEPDLTVRVIRDVFNEDFASLVVAGRRRPGTGQRLRQLRGARPRRPGHQVDRRAGRLRRTTGSTSSSPRRMDRKVWLPSGGSLVIDRTEAMTVVDVNTGKFVGSGRQPRGDGHQEQPRGGRGDRPPAPAARHRRHHRHRLHRHGAGEQPRPGRTTPAGVPGPRPHQAPGGRGDLARAGADDPQAGRSAA